MTTRREALGFALGWLLWGLFRGAERWTISTGLVMRASPAPPLGSLVYTFASALLMALAWAVVTVPIRWAWTRIPRLRRAPLRALGLHLTLAIAAAACVLGLFTFLVLLAFPERRGESPYLHEIAGRIPVYVNQIALTYTTLVTVFWLLRRLKEDRESALRAATLERELADAQLETLTTQLNPPFFFSTLNAILPLVRKDPDLAARTVVQLGDLLRLTFRSEGSRLVPLEEELRTLDLYLKIETTRFQDRLRLTLDVDPAAREALVPNLLLLPLVENAIQRGVAHRPGPGRLLVAANADAELRLSVRWEGLPPAGGDGDALDTTRQRLARLYPGRHRLEAGGSAPEVRVVLPFDRPAQAAVA